MNKKAGKLLRDRRAMATPLTVALVLGLLVFLCVFAEFFRLSIIAGGVRNALQSAAVSVATTNYDDVYDGLREGYSGGYYYEEDRGWAEYMDSGDVYGQLGLLLGLDDREDYLVKWLDTGYEYRISELKISLKNASFAPGGTNENFEADISVKLEVPLSFGWDFLPPLSMQVRTKAAYMPKF